LREQQSQTPDEERGAGMGTFRGERETLVVYDDEARLTGGAGRLFSFNRRLVDEALAAGGRVVEEHRRDGRAVAWDVDVPVTAIRIGFRSKKRVLSPEQREAAAARARGLRNRPALVAEDDKKSCSATEALEAKA
jgi:hypothetical protein